MNGAHVAEAGDTRVEGAEGHDLGEVLGFMRLLWAVDHGLEASSKRMDARFGVTGPQRLVLRLVGRFPGISAGELASILRVHPSTLTGVFQRLERRRLVTRRTDPEDRRRSLFSLTDRGRRINAVRGGTVESAVRRAMRRLPPETIAAAGQVLAVLAAELQRDG